MINYDTILSNYEDKLTLMQWLDKVEKALKDATATGFHLNKTGTSTLTFSIDFDDGTTLTSEPVVINQGESVASAAINNGVLTLTLTNGQVLSAGNIFNGNLTLNGDLTITGDLICPYIDVSGDIDCGGKLGVVGKANLFGGLAVTGNITGDSIIENMTGYSAAANTSDLNWTPIYIGACKNGNKLTLVVFGSCVIDDNTSANANVIGFNIPSSIGQKLFPTTIGGWQVIENKEIPFTNSSNFAYISYVKGALVKTNDTYIYLRLDNVGALTNGNYFFRYEGTFLLSNSLI